jgi:hypothetical protein
MKSFSFRTCKCVDRVAPSKQRRRQHDGKERDYEQGENQQNKG